MRPGHAGRAPGRPRGGDQTLASHVRVGFTVKCCQGSLPTRVSRGQGSRNHGRSSGQNIRGRPFRDAYLTIAPRRERDERAAREGLDRSKRRHVIRAVSHAVFHAAFRALLLSVGTVRGAPLRAGLTLVGFAIGTAALSAVSLLSDSLADLNRRQLAASGFANLQVEPVRSYWLDGVVFEYPDPPPIIPMEFAEQLAGTLGSRATVFAVDSTAIELRIGQRLRGVALVSSAPVDGSQPSSSHDLGSVIVSRRLESLLRRENGKHALDSLALPTRVVSISHVADNPHGVTQLVVYVSPALLAEIAPSAERHLLVVPRHEAIDDNYKDVLRLTERAVRGHTDFGERVEVSAPGPGRLSRLNTALMVFRLSFSTVALLCIVVAGLGAANVVLLATIQRAREVGLRRSVGATRSDIKLQFAFESMILAVGGGVFGLAMGWAIIQLTASIIAARTSIEMHVAFNTFSALMPMATAVGVGLVAAVVPAARAASIDPATALRDE